MSVLDYILGRPLSTIEERGERTGPAAGIGIFGLDALGSAAYGPEAALTVMMGLGVLSTAYVMPISLSIIVLLGILYFSYRQTIAAYPGGGGSYTVARENLGAFPGLLAASALMIDYILNVAVGISAGIGALVSAMPALQPHTLELCLGVLAVITLVNLRGVRETGFVFMAPTYLFVGSLLLAICVGIVKTIASGGSPVPVVAPPKLGPPTMAMGWWLLLQAFSSGCTAMTGVEAVSNGVRAFREPVVQSAQRTLTAIIAILMTLLGGIAYLVKVYNIGATEPGKAGYESVLSQLLGAVVGKGGFYYVAIAGIILVLAFSANTSFADFPRLCRAIAENGYLPNSFGTRGRRLVYTQGIVVLAMISGSLLFLFGGVTDRLIPLFAVGAFLAFTLSQAGMVVHWKRTGGPQAGHSMLINGVGAIATAITTGVVLSAKFAEGAWITVLLIPALLLTMLAVHRHYEWLARQIAAPPTFDPGKPNPPLVVVPIQRWNKIAAKGLRFALNISPDVYGLHINCDESDNLKDEWEKHVATPARESGLREPELKSIDSPYRYIVMPIVDYVLELEHRYPDRLVAVVIPELVEDRWYNYLLHNQRASVLKALLLLKGDRRIIVINVPWYLK
jgi:amino acid transporter